VSQTPFGATWTRPDGRFTFTFLNKGLKAFTGKTSSLYLLVKYVSALMRRDDAARGADAPPLKRYMLLADTRIVFGADSVSTMLDYMRTHDDVM